MKHIKIIPKKLSGTVKIPPSKSISHRAIIAGALSEGDCRINNIDFSDDINATIDGMTALGANILKGEDFIEIKKSTPKYSNNIIIDCVESGSTLRFLIPISLLKQEYTTFIGKGNLGKRPLTPYYDIFDKQNIDYKYDEDKLNLTVKGPLKNDNFNIDGNISSQFITGLLFALPLLKGESTVTINGSLQSKGYIDLTLKVLEDFGINIENKNYESFIIKGNQKYSSVDFNVEGDFSQSAFFLVGGAIGNDLKCLNLNTNSLQGDKQILKIIENMNGKINIENDLIYSSYKKTEGITIDASQIPDLVPVLSVLASLSTGTTRIINAGRLRLKECDRLKAIATELNKIGGKVTELEDSLLIEGVSSFTGGEVWSWNDHRIAMSLAIASTRCQEPLIIKDADSVKKSYPDFWKHFIHLGGEIYEWNMG